MVQRCRCCLYADSCQSEQTCEYFLPIDYEKRIEKKLEEINMTRFEREWEEYVDHWGEDNFLLSNLTDYD